jgi:hypothetical protein
MRIQVAGDGGHGRNGMARGSDEAWGLDEGVGGDTSGATTRAIGVA